MIDLNLLRNESDLVKKLILKKEPKFNVDRLLELDLTVRGLTQEVEFLRKEKNDLAGKGAKGITDEIRNKSIEIGKKLKNKTEELEVLSVEFKGLALSCPNVLQDVVPEGNKDENVAVKTVGEPTKFNFKLKNHLQLNEKLNWFDLEAATAMSGSGFVLYKGDGVKVIYALTQMMLRNNVKHGFEPILPPYLATEKALINSGNLPKFEGDFYKIDDDGLCLIPTAEVNLTNLYANKILKTDELPIRNCAWTSCFRREAGGYGSQERGLIRIHQFEKVELYSITESEKSNDELDRMVICAEDILQQLGLSYQISLLAAQDCSFASSKTFDIEVWLPGQDRYYEVSSCSNCTDFQARRAKIRYRSGDGEKPTLVHTLNASSLALPRLMVALMENYQQEDGTVLLPDSLQKVMDSLW